MMMPEQGRHICRDVVNKKSVLENLDLVLITIDETVDQGYALTCSIW